MDKDVPALYDAAMAEHGFVAVDNPVYDLVSVKKETSKSIWNDKKDYPIRISGIDFTLQHFEHRV